jgi:ion channel-forming bestrophin family protein
MGDDGEHFQPKSQAHPTISTIHKSSSETEIEHDGFEMPTSPRNYRNPASRQNTSLDVDAYFVGPRDTMRHSKWPTFLRMHGSILPEMILPLAFVAGWSTLVTCLCRFVFNCTRS